MWDVHYEDLAVHDVPTAVQLNQFYFAKPGDPPATMRFERIYFQNITVHAGGGGSSGSGGDTSAVVNLDCDTKYNGVNNCDVVFEHVHFIGLSTHDEQHGMVCKGVKGTATVRLSGTRARTHAQREREREREREEVSVVHYLCGTRPAGARCSFCGVVGVMVRQQNNCCCCCC